MFQPAGRLIIAIAVARAAASASHAGSPPPAAPLTTVITHGFSTADKGAWVQAMAEAIIARGSGGSIYRYTGATATWTYVPSPAADGTSNNIVCIFNWVPESDAPDTGPNWNYAQAAGDAMYAALRDPRYAGSPGSPPTSLVENRWLHLIGHSRGACVISEAAIRLARDGRSVDHITGLDPHPVNGTLDSPFNFNWNDPTPRRWSNVTFADTYWRADGGGLNALDFDGIPIDGGFSTQLSESALNCSGCGYSGAHSDVHLWLHGTIDLAAGPCDGEACINNSMRSTWWPEGYAQRGWFYSRLGGGAALRPAVGPATAPPATPFIVNGDFSSASYAGWSFHGGTVGGQVVNESGVQYLKIGAGVGASPLARHNRFFVPAGATQIELDSRVLAGATAGAQTLRITLTDQNGAAFVVADDPIAIAPGRWVLNRQFAIGPAVPRSRVYTLTLQVIASGPAAAVMGIDNVDLNMAAPVTGDLNGDGCVDVNDLLTVINAWGPCPAAPTDCPADANASGTVDVNDLLMVINHWGCG